jgi:hypothetical protein
MSEILRFFFLVLFLTISLAAYFLTTQSLFAGRVARTKAILQSLPLRSSGIGLVNFSFFFVIAVVFLSIADNIDSGFFKVILMIPGLVLLAFIAVMLSFGLAAMAAHVGEKLLPEAPWWKETLGGAVCLSLACALPFVGWFVLFPYLGCSGIGAFILGIFQREPKS